MDAKAGAEVSLAKTRVEMMHTNSQLLETVRQKVSISEQVEDLQEKMDSLLHQQVADKLGQLDRQSAQTAAPPQPTGYNRYVHWVKDLTSNLYNSHGD